MKKSIKLKKGDLVKPPQLQKNDLFIMKFGFSECTFGVNQTRSDGSILAHATSWLESAALVFDTEGRTKYHLRYIPADPMYYAGRMSKLRAFFIRYFW